MADMAAMYGRLTGKLPASASAPSDPAPPTSTGWARRTWTTCRWSRITGQVRSPGSTRSRTQEVDVVAMFEPVTKWSETVHNARTIPERSCARPSALAQAEKPGATQCRAARRTWPRVTSPSRPIVPGRPGAPARRRREVDRRRPWT